MDSYSSGERFNVKTRKPYTITKQRERWTEDEHNSFLEALKLYGRAWQRIEEHIGTKTAVQIRSHAQKFFTKLEKEAVAKGVPIRQALDMEIPPPRPKRKPNYPYPRKTGPKNVDASLVSSMQSGIQILDLERKPPPETTSHEEKLENAEANDEVEIGIEGPSLSQEAPSENENSIPRSVEAGVFREFIPALEEVVNHDETNESFITVETRKHQSLDEDGIKHTTITSNTSFLHQNIIHDQSCDKLGNVGTLSINDMRGVHNYPRHVPVQVVEGKNSIPQETSFQESTLENPNIFVNIAAASATTGHASTSSGYQTVPAFHPLYTPICDNQDNHTSFLQVSSTISSLIVSSLLQNPAAHAAARFAATFWHPPNTEASSGDSSSRDQLNSETPSMAAIAAATVAAATAWWAAHGLLPVCTPFYPGNSSTSPFPYGTPINGTHARVTDNGREKAPLEGVLQEKKMDAEKPEGKPAYLSSSEDSDGERDKKLNTGPSAADTKEMAPVEESNVRKQVDRSSCGSNTTSSSEIETDALEKHAKEKEETKGPDVNVPCNDSIFRRSSRNTISPYESWKEVSEEGRLAFQALFSREVLPQSFSNGELDLNRLSCSSQEAGEKNERKMEEGLLRMGLENVKLNAHHTGFKPYKRCSIEAKESNSKASTGTQNDEKGPKRMRLEAEATT